MGTEDQSNRLIFVHWLIYSDGNRALLGSSVASILARCASLQQQEKSTRSSKDIGNRYSHAIFRDQFVHGTLSGSFVLGCRIVPGLYRAILASRHRHFTAGASEFISGRPDVRELRSSGTRDARFNRPG